MKSTISGKHVVLRPFDDDDAAFFACWYNEPEVMFERGFHEHTTLEAELKRIQRPDSDEDWYAITEKKTGRIIGETGLLRMCGPIGIVPICQ